MTTLITTTPKPILVVGIQKSATEIKVLEDNSIMWKISQQPPAYEAHDLPPGKWKIAFLLSDRTEEMAKGIVLGNNGGYGDTTWQDYAVNGFAPFHFATALESIESLFKAAAIPAHEDYIILVEEGEGWRIAL